MIAILMVAFAGQAHAQSDDTLLLMNRLNDLEAQVQQLKRNAGNSGAPTSLNGGYTGMAPAVSGPAGAGSADLDVRLSQLQDQVRNLTGEIETQGNQIAQLRTESQRLNQDMQMRLNDVEAKVGGSPVPSTAAGSTGPAGSVSNGMYGPSGPPETPQQLNSTTLVPGPDGSVPASAALTPEKEYEIAYNHLGQGDYADAETGFSAFLQKYPKQPLASNAKYWLGETYFQRGMTDKAATTFAECYKQYPNGPKAPDSLLRLGQSLGQSGKTQQACVAFAEVTKQFPAVSPKIKTSLVQERSRYSCQ